MGNLCVVMIGDEGLLRRIIGIINRIDKDIGKFLNSFRKLGMFFYIFFFFNK